MDERRGVLVMAYGTPHSLDDVAAYYTDIRRGRPPPPELLEELADRYRAIGGSPLLEITEAQARGIQERLGIDTYLGQKHAAPFIRDAMERIAKDSVTEVVGFVLAPHYSRLSIGDYESRARRTAEEIEWTGKLKMVQSWHLEPGYVRWLAAAVDAALETLSPTARAEAVVIFTAHSLPERIVASGDPYPAQLEETAAGVANELGLQKWRTAWQSAGRTQEAWLGPDFTDVIPQLGRDGVQGVVVCPCGFVADHLEVLYDVDIEARRVADKANVELARTAMPNDDDAFLDMAAGVIRNAFE